MRLSSRSKTGLDRLANEAWAAWQTSRERPKAGWGERFLGISLKEERYLLL